MVEHKKYDLNRTSYYSIDVVFHVGCCLLLDDEWVVVGEGMGEGSGDVLGLDRFADGLGHLLLGLDAVDHLGDVAGLEGDDLGDDLGRVDAVLGDGLVAAVLDGGHGGGHCWSVCWKAVVGSAVPLRISLSLALVQEVGRASTVSRGDFLAELLVFNGLVFDLVSFADVFCPRSAALGGDDLVGNLAVGSQGGGSGHDSWSNSWSSSNQDLGIGLGSCHGSGGQAGNSKELVHYDGFCEYTSHEEVSS